MKWETFFGTALIVSLIIFIQWPKMKRQPKKDKAAFIVLLVIGLVLSLFNLEDIEGPATLREIVLKPFSKYMQE